MSRPKASRPRPDDPIPASIVALLQESDASVVADIEQEVAQVVEVLSAATRRSDDSVVPATPHRRAQAER